MGQCATTSFVAVSIILTASFDSLELAINSAPLWLNCRQSTFVVRLFVTCELFSDIIVRKTIMSTLTSAALSDFSSFLAVGFNGLKVP